MYRPFERHELIELGQVSAKGRRWRFACRTSTVARDLNRFILRSDCASYVDPFLRSILTSRCLF
jgi:hypothetical protein